MRKIITNRRQIHDLHPGDLDVHIGYRPAEKDVFLLLEKSPDLKSIQLPGGFHNSLSQTTRQLLIMRGIKLLEGNVHDSEKYLV